jgi:hypothetical protein
VDTAESPSPTIHVPTRKRLAVSWLHRPRSGRHPENIRVRCKTFGAAILRLKKLDVDSIRYLVTAAATCRLHSTAMCGAHIHALELMDDAVVAITKTQSTEAERRAPSRSNRILYQCRSQRPPGYLQVRTQPIDIYGIQMRHEPFRGRLRIRKKSYAKVCPLRSSCTSRVARRRSAVE